MRKEDLREATKRAAEWDGHKLKTHLSQVEKRMATVAAVYSIELQVRTPGSIRGVEGQKEEAPKARARHKRVWASVERTPEQVTEEVFQEARRRDLEGKRSWVMLVDGHEGQLEDIHAAIDRSGVEVTLILDFTRARISLEGRLVFLRDEPGLFGGKDQTRVTHRRRHASPLFCQGN